MPWEWGSEMSNRAIETFVIWPACSVTFTWSSPYWKLTASPTAARVPELLDAVELELVVVTERLGGELVVAVAPAAECEVRLNPDAVGADRFFEAGLDAARLAPVVGLVAWKETTAVTPTAVPAAT